MHVSASLPSFIGVLMHLLGVSPRKEESSMTYEFMNEGVAKRSKGTRRLTTQRIDAVFTINVGMNVPVQLEGAAYPAGASRLRAPSTVTFGFHP